MLKTWLIALATLILAISAPASALDTYSHHQVVALLANAEQTRQAERRVSNSAMNSQRASIDALNVRISRLEGEADALGRTNREQLREIERLKSEYIALTEAHTAELAQLDAVYARERQLLLEAGETWASTEEGLEILRAFNDGDRLRSLALANDLARRHAEITNERAAISNAAQYRATAVLATQTWRYREIGIAALIEYWDAVPATGQATYSDWLQLASLNRTAGRLDDALTAAKEAEKRVDGGRELSLALAEIGIIYTRQGNILALDHLQRAITIFAEEAPEPAPDAARESLASYGYEQAQLYNFYGQALESFDDCEEAYKQYLEARGVMSILQLQFPQIYSINLRYAESHMNVGDAISCLTVADDELDKQYSEALATYIQSHDIYATLLVYEQGDLEIKRGVLFTTDRILALYALENDQSFYDAESREIYASDMEIAKNFPIETDADAISLNNIANSISALANLRAGQGFPDDALALFDDGLFLARRLAEHDPTSIRFSNNLVGILKKVGEFQLAQNQQEAALRHFAESEAIAAQLADDNASAALLINHSEILRLYGATLASLGHTGEAVEQFERDLAVNLRLAASEHLDMIGTTATDVQTRILETLWQLARAAPERHPWRRVHDQLVQMQHAAIMFDELPEYLEIARQRMEEQEAASTP